MEWKNKAHFPTLQLNDFVLMVWYHWLKSLKTVKL